MEPDPSRTPAMEPPPGVESNLDNPETLQPTRIALSAVCITLCVVFITARCYARAVLLNKFDLDDWCLLVSCAGFIIFTALLIAAGEHGDGTHLWDVSIADFSVNLRLVNIVEIFYSPTMFFVKYVILRQIEGIFLNHRYKNAAFKIIRVLIWANLIFYAAIMFSFIFACVPREKIWHPKMEGKCINTVTSIIATSAINIISDVTILIVPVAAVMRLQMRLRARLGVAAVFGVGILVTVAGIVRLYYSVQLLYTHDITWAVAPVGQWAILEFTAAFFVACCPQFPRLFKELTGRGSTTRSGYLHSYGPHTTPRSQRNQLSAARVSRKIDTGDSSSTRGLRDHAVEEAIPTEHHIGLDSVQKPGIAL